VAQCGARPVFVDVDPLTGNIDPGEAAMAIGPATRALLVVHQLGMPCDLPALRALARARGLPLVEDAACAAGSEILWNGDWQKIGRPHGDIACFSFHPRKLLTTGDGGMITTGSAELDRRLRLLRQHGMSVPDSVRHGSPQVIFESYEEPGFNYRLTDIQAAVGRVQLARLPGMLAERRHLAARYTSALSGIAGIAPPHEPNWARTNWQTYQARLDPAIDLKRVMQGLLDRGIATRRGVMCAHREPAWPAGTWRLGGTGLAASEALQDHGLILPLFPGMTEADQDMVIAALRAVL
jgi:dTDP-4-amino-4,6-dideoxygalactose transaminase